VYLRKGHTLGSLQHAPQLTHRPFRLSQTGNIEVKILFILADHVFFLLPPSSQRTLRFLVLSLFLLLFLFSSVFSAVSFFFLSAIGAMIFMIF